MSKSRTLLGVICLVVLACAGAFFFRAGGEKAEITLKGVPYQMNSMTVREFMGEDYLFAAMSIEGNSVYTYDYTDAALEAKSYYNMAVPFRPKDGYGAPISCWLYNPTAQPVEIREGQICAIACEIAPLREHGVPVAVAGHTLDAQTKTEIKAYMDNALKGYAYSENEDANAFTYRKGRVSYTFTFDETDTVATAVARNEV